MHSFALSHHPDVPFNGLFYATAAAVIPILFLAIAVQGTWFDQTLRRASVASRHAEPDDPVVRLLRSSLYSTEEQREKAERDFAWRRRIFLPAARIVVGAGYVGEGIAFIALYRQTVSGLEGSAVLVALLILGSAVVSGPMVALNRIDVEPMAEWMANRIKYFEELAKKIEENQQGQATPMATPLESDETVAEAGDRPPAHGDEHLREPGAG